MTYPPPYYTETDPKFLHRIMADNGFAMLVTGGLEATHLPLLYKEKGKRGALYGHLAKSNPICANMNNTQALAVFSGPHGYVSANLYDDPSANVPTWNYASVQVRGRLSCLPDDHVIWHLRDMAETYEGQNGWVLNDASDYVARIRSGIVAFEFNIDSFQAFRKMSGNKPPAIRKRIIDAARAQGEEAFATEMETTQNE